MSTSTPASSTAQWHLRVWWLAAPIILSNVTVPLVGAVDTAVTGHMDTPEPIAAVALGASIFSLIFWTFGFLKMGTSGSVAQAFGAKDTGHSRCNNRRSQSQLYADSNLVSTRHPCQLCSYRRTDWNTTNALGICFPAGVKLH